ncbi:putative polygalacturonase At3g15720 [Bidens hawaiensis]|uniref:putative polygalacturonase At3g15720 n=1 Tax=Bidens hawaiensis TaxID=980011 RepID=UPI00404A4154
MEQRTILLIVSLVYFLQQSSAAGYNIMQFGAKGDGHTDDTLAFERAWQVVCHDVGPSSKLTIPKPNTFLVSPISFQGPCKASRVHLEILGTIIAPLDPRSWNGCETGAWMYFYGVSGLVIDGGGTINGRGNAWWTKKSSIYIQEESNCDTPPTAMHFQSCNGLQLRNLRHLDSPRNHIGLSQCSYSTLSYLYIAAPANSANTDGIDISHSTQVRVRNSVIRTGDDCIALNSETSQININGIFCGPGHGISIGSLGGNGEYDTVEGIKVQNCTFSGTTNGARIKTWQGGSGYARDITFENIILHNVENPIIIDQFYCPNKHDCPKKPSALKVSDISYKSFFGTSSSRNALNFDCSDNVPCLGILLDQVNIRSSAQGEDTTAYCNNAYGTSSFSRPAASCLLN